MFGLFKKKEIYSKGSLERSPEFQKMILGAFRADDETEKVICNYEDEQKNTYFFYPLSSYKDGSSVYGAFAIWNKGVDPTSEQLKIIKITNGKIKQILFSCKSQQLNETDSRRTHFNFQCVTIKLENAVMQELIQKIENYAGLLAYKNPPPYVAALRLYEQSSGSPEGHHYLHQDLFNNIVLVSYSQFRPKYKDFKQYWSGKMTIETKGGTETINAITLMQQYCQHYERDDLLSNHFGQASLTLDTYIEKNYGFNQRVWVEIQRIQKISDMYTSHGIKIREVGQRFAPSHPEPTRRVEFFMKDFERYASQVSL